MAEKVKKKDLFNRLRSTSMHRRKQIARQQAGRAQSFGGKKKGGAGGFWKKELYIRAPREEKGRLTQPPTELLRFIPGEYDVPPHMLEGSDDYVEGDVLPHYVHLSHYHPNRGYEGKGCQILDTKDWCEGDDISTHLKDMGDDTINTRPMAFHSVLHLGYWHLVPEEITVTDRDSGKDKQITVHELERCTGRKCELCEAGHDRQFGRPGYVMLSPNIQAGLDKLEHEIGMFCTCGCATPLQVFKYECSGCGHVYAEAGFDENLGEIDDPLTLEDLGELYDTNPECPECGVPIDEVRADEAAVFIEEIILCENCGGGGAAERATIYHADLALKKTGLKAKVQLELDRHKFDAKGFAIRDIHEELMDMIEIYDFFKDLSTDPKKQSKRLRLSQQEWDDFQAQTQPEEEQGYTSRGKDPKRRSKY
jgi:hypothetical protein